MISKETRAKYKVTIGIECHVQLKTRTKLFSAVNNDAREATPNTLISHIDLGMPGALPVLNEEAINLAMKAAFALNTKPQHFSKFDRKHYFYPDLPKGYQITQYDQPIVVGGFVDINVNGQPKQVNITRAHLEEDAGKTTHPTGADYSLVDLNRAGTPLLEIVSEPDMHSSAEAKAYVRELWLLMRYADVSDADLYHGNMRFDVNVSVSKNEQLGTRTETKNLNSFRSVEKAIEYETERQIELLEKGQSIAQETRGWDDAKQKTFSQRGKEEAHDYRYFPEPDLPPVVLSSQQVDKVQKNMTALPGSIRNRLQTFQLDSASIETLLDEIPAGQLIIQLIDQKVKPELIKKIANWLVGDVQAQVSSGELGWEDLKLEPHYLIKLAELVNDNKVSSSGAKVVLLEMLASGGDPAAIAKTKSVLQLSDESELTKIVAQVIKDNPKPVEDVRKGEMKAIGFLVGQIMKESKGQANPGLAQKLIKEQLKI